MPPSGLKQKRSEALIERDISIYRRKMAGLSVRAICDEFAIKSTKTTHDAILRGKEYVKDRGIDVEERRIEIDELFKSTLGALAKDVLKQSQQGVVREDFDGDGKLIASHRTYGVSPRTAGELSRSLHRWASFLGLCEVAPGEGTGGTTLIQLTMPSSGGELEQRWASASAEPAAGEQTVDAAAQEVAPPAPELGQGEGEAPAS